MSKAAQERAAAQAAAKSLPERETYSAKQAAMRLSTDARTFRKFLRSSHCSFKAVGQGKRYEFSGEQLEELKEEFAAWRAYAESRRTTSTPKLNGHPVDTVPIHQVMDKARDIYLEDKTTTLDIAVSEFEDIMDREPTPEELIAIEMNLTEEEY